MLSKIQFAARIFLGLIYFIFGGMGLGIAMGLLKMPAPAGMPEAAMTFMNGIMATGYFFPLLKITETLGGFLLLTGFAAPVALVILAPITLQILLFHSFLTPSAGELALPVFMCLAHLTAASKYCTLYKPLFGNRKI